jgi:uncharacterized protein GlcG (DUF336 family)
LQPTKYKDHRTHMKRPLLSLFMVVLLVAQSTAAAQEPAANLRITVLEGEGSMNNIKLRSPRNLVVQVEDSNKKPLPQVAVTFTAPTTGAGGAFSNGDATTTVTTDTQGRASVRGFRPNTQPGKFEIRVSASSNGETARAAITQFNMAVSAPAPKKSNSGKLIAIVAVVGGAAAAGGFIATRKSGTTTPPPLPSLTVSAGAGSVGPPQ